MHHTSTNATPLNLRSECPANGEQNVSPADRRKAGWLMDYECAGAVRMRLDPAYTSAPFATVRTGGEGDIMVHGAFVFRGKCVVTLVSLAVVVAGATTAGPRPAVAGWFSPPGGTWCAMQATGLNDCSYFSQRQCQATLSGIGGSCVPNLQAPAEAFVSPPPSPPRKAKRAYGPPPPVPPPPVYMGPNYGPPPPPYYR
jgi:hypothetical protein